MGDFLEKTYVCNHATRRNFVEKFNRSPEEVETIHIGVDYEKYNPEVVPYGKIRKEFNISDEDKIILFPCRLHSHRCSSIASRSPIHLFHMYIVNNCHIWELSS